ncbi:MAG: DNA mismatch repair endonuclease MutL [Nostocaceae cyanobacterium]|nr:DNA mismatch repair endonuclease MutL [Nostocaceae cyanobacterium]
MASMIQALPSEVVNLIAAGEVIDSLAAVVRELVENSLDAGATRIVISLYPQQWRVRIADNGCGMNLVDLQQAAVAHTTSKISHCEDLWQITSLGFRGEALHSLTTLADLEILSREANSLAGGWRVVYGDGGKTLALEAAAIAPGTVVTVSNLFGNWSFRRQGLPSIAQQMKATQATIYQIALCHPHVTWQVWHNDREWFTLSPATTTSQLLCQIVPQVNKSDLQELKLEIPNRTKSTLNLVLGLPDRCHRHRPDWVRLAVNGRMVKLPELEQTILAGFHKTLPRDRYPVCFVHLQIPPEQINWNRHPAKTEIYLQELTYWQEQISAAIEQALRLNSTHLTLEFHNSRVSQLIKAAEEKGGYKVNRSISPKPIQKAAQSTPHFLKAVAQVNNTYIVAEHPGGLWLVEQHIAHERVLYEQLCDNWQLVPVEPPIILNNLSPAQIEQLQRIGLEIEPFGEQIWAVRTVPAMLHSRSDCSAAILELSWGGDLKSAQVAVACRSAIRNGTHLSLQEMQTILDEWQSTRSPRTCPHGRPIYLSLEESALARYFRRHWVIGKSHGI